MISKELLLILGYMDGLKRENVDGFFLLPGSLENIRLNLERI